MDQCPSDSNLVCPDFPDAPSSLNQRTPARSFFHYESHGPLNSVHYASQGVRERTQELASYSLSNPSSLPSSFSRCRPAKGVMAVRSSVVSANSWSPRVPDRFDDVIPPDFRDDLEPRSLEDSKNTMRRSSNLNNPFCAFPSNRSEDLKDSDIETLNTGMYRHPPADACSSSTTSHNISEITPLLQSHKSIDSQYEHLCGDPRDFGTCSVLKAQKWTHFLHKRRYDMKDIFWNVLLEPAKSLPAVFLGVLLNILDGLSYGFILFPLSSPIFADTGPDGVSMFYVSCIVSQLTYSLGFSQFEGGVGSEMIEVVPFLHKMAFIITGHIGVENSKAVIATVIASYCLSSIITGIIFLILGYFNLGSLVNFLPRSLLTGCIGGIGFFLMITGIEVSAGLGGSLNFNMSTLKDLFQLHTATLWIIPFILAVAYMGIKHRFDHPSIFPGYIIAIIVIFHTIIAAIPNMDLEDVRNKGWIFARPNPQIPFYNFYYYFDPALISFSAIANTIPTMLALSFFGIIHVPINIPALGVAIEEDHINMNRELIAHGVSNALSGFLGSVQNYLVYVNSVMFIKHGGNSRLAGVLLALATTAVWVFGQPLIGFTPIMIVGCLIFYLGIELLKESLWDTWGKLSKLEYIMILLIVIIMGLYDFVVGTVAGITLSCLIYVVQTSRTPAIRATYSGKIAESTVRRPVIQRKFLRVVGSQVYVAKLSGYLFFGSIALVEKTVDGLIDEEFFKEHPVRFVILDFSHVEGLDYSAAEAFIRMNRVLRRKNIEMILSNVALGDQVGKSLTMVGLLQAKYDKDSLLSPRVFEDLNKALEACENELLTIFIDRTRSSRYSDQQGAQPVAVPCVRLTPSFEPAVSSPRRLLVQQAAAMTLNEHADSTLSDNDIVMPAKWRHFAQPVLLMLQTFHELTDKNEDFWHLATPYFERQEYATGTVLYERGDSSDGFYLLERGVLRVEYDLEQGNYHELILPGTTCGELPFFSETGRTGTAVVVQASIMWLISVSNWKALRRDCPDLAVELLKISLKLTRERMETITSYFLVMSG